jgi:hypothetical protein
MKCVECETEVYKAIFWGLPVSFCPCCYSIFSPNFLVDSLIGTILFFEDHFGNGEIVLMSYDTDYPTALKHYLFGNLEE